MKEVRVMVRFHIEMEGYEVEEASSGKEGLEQIALCRPDLVLLDYHMPDMTGLTMLQKLRQSNDKVPVVMLTADSNQGIAVQAFRDGADDFISKPFDPDFLKIVVSRTLKSLKLQIMLQESEVARRAAEQANHLKSRFIENMNHEARTSTNGVNGFLDIAVKKITKGEVAEALKFITWAHENSDRLLTLFDRIIDLSQLQAGHIIYRFMQKELQELVNYAIENVEIYAQAKNIQIKTNTLEKISVWCDGLRMGQVFAELLINAVKYSQKDTVVTLQITKEDGFVKVLVTDAGCGIPDGELESIFDPFTLSSRTDHGASGKGLGLALCRQIVRDHGGKILVDNNPEKGSTFSLIIPVQHK